VLGEMRDPIPLGQTQIPTMISVWFNLDLHSEKAAIDCLSYGTYCLVYNLELMFLSLSLSLTGLCMAVLTTALAVTENWEVKLCYFQHSQNSLDS